MKMWLVNVRVSLWWWTFGGLTGGHPWELWWQRRSTSLTRCGCPKHAYHSIYTTSIVTCTVTSWFVVLIIIVVITCPVKGMTPAISHRQEYSEEIVDDHMSSEGDDSSYQPLTRVFWRDRKWGQRWVGRLKRGLRGWGVVMMLTACDTKAYHDKCLYKRQSCI